MAPKAHKAAAAEQAAKEPPHKAYDKLRAEISKVKELKKPSTKAAQHLSKTIQEALIERAPGVLVLAQEAENLLGEVVVKVVQITFRDAAESKDFSNVQSEYEILMGLRLQKAQHTEAQATMHSLLRDKFESDTNESVAQDMHVTARGRGAFPDTGCVINTAEERGITLRQMRDIYATVQLRCVIEGWVGFPNGQQGPPQLLTPEAVTLYDMDRYLIKPATLQRKCSMVELLAVAPQPPSWFVSHWWGEPVSDFIRCLEQHSRDFAKGGYDAERQMQMPPADDNTPYWVCAVSPARAPYMPASNLTLSSASILALDSRSFSMPTTSGTSTLP